MQTQYLIIAKKVDNKRDPLRAVRAQLDHFPIHLADSIFVLSFLSISDSQSPVLIQHCPDHSPSTCCCVSAGSLLLCHILAFLRAKISFFPFSFFARRKILTPHPPHSHPHTHSHSHHGSHHLPRPWRRRYPLPFISLNLKVVNKLTNAHRNQETCSPPNHQPRPQTSSPPPSNKTSTPPAAAAPET